MNTNSNYKKNAGIDFSESADVKTVIPNIAVLEFPFTDFPDRMKIVLTFAHQET
ncbi:hypothetical protein JOD55_001080 [Arcanobacterium pluranimalium]|uniref:hypothetical protein n=1 Tax=Arcanobacterium pluranimalium TaxID=108028 RepID=UPI00195D70FD|nr:hypothetical protein [Arcanobacterium pluranimalium]MBM7825253.1 hypothetical protein [Arcanobacterium pluranimalium]